MILLISYHPARRRSPAMTFARRQPFARADLSDEDQEFVGSRVCRINQSWARCKFSKPQMRTESPVSIPMNT